jgi:hypothetical protein
MTQPKAMTLAEWIESDMTTVPGDTYFNFRDREVVAELRRLVAQRDALLEALVKCRDRFFPADQPEQDRDELWGPVNAAIKTVEGEKT